MSRFTPTGFNDFSHYRGAGGRFAAHSGARYALWRGTGTVLANPLQYGLIYGILIGQISGPHNVKWTGREIPGFERAATMVNGKARTDPKARSDPKIRQNPKLGPGQMPPFRNPMYKRYRARGGYRRSGGYTWGRRRSGWGRPYGRRRTYRRRYNRY